MKAKRIATLLVAAAMIAGAMPANVFAGRINYEPEEAETPEITEQEEKEPAKPTEKETKPAEKETEPEVKEPEETKAPEAEEPKEKETEAPEQAEEPKTEETEETGKSGAGTPETGEKAEPEAPAEGAEPEAEEEKAPEAPVSVKAKNSPDFNMKSFKFSNGILSWEAVDDAVSYSISTGGASVNTNTNSFDVAKWIDGLIEQREIYKDNGYDLYIHAYDADDNTVAFTQVAITYKSKAEPKTVLPKITNVKISNGVVTWDAYDNGGAKFAGYYVRIVGDQTLMEHVEQTGETSVDLKKVIVENVKYGYTELPNYKIQIVALEDISWVPIAESSYVTYNYKKANTMTVKTKKVKVRKTRVKKKSQSFKRTKVLTIKKAVGKLTYKKLSGSAKITINKSTGKLTVKKKTNKGTYKIQVLVRAGGNSKYAPSTKKVTITVKVR